MAARRISDCRETRTPRVRETCARGLGCASLVVVVCVTVLRSSDGGKSAPVAAPPRNTASRHAVQNGLKPRPWITVGKERTYVTQPVDDAGYIDYVAALNAAGKEGVTVDNNAAVLLVRAMELGSLTGADRARFFELLGIEQQSPIAGSFPELSQLANNRAFDYDETIASLPWSEAEFPSRAFWLKGHKQGLELATEAARRPRCYFPLIRTADAEMIFDLPLPALQTSRWIAAALTSRALLEVNDGRIAEAQQDLLACHRLARLVGSGPFLIDGHVGAALDSDASSADAALLQSGKLFGSDAIAYRAELRKLPPLPKVADCLDRGERMMLLGFFTDLARKQQPELEDMLLPLSPYVSPEILVQVLTDEMTVIWGEALLAANADWDRWVAAARTPFSSGRMQQFEKLGTEARGLLKDFSAGSSDLSPEQKGRIMGRSVTAHLLPEMRNSNQTEVRAEIRRDLVDLGLALVAYHSDFGIYPATLEELIPQYCTELPPDRFTAKPLHYARQEDGYLLYSVGENLTDDGGRGGGSQPPGDDLAIRIGGKRTAGPPAEVTRGLISEQLRIVISALAGLAGLLIVGIYLMVRMRQRT